MWTQRPRPTDPTLRPAAKMTRDGPTDRPSAVRSAAKFWAGTDRAQQPALLAAHGPAHRLHALPGACRHPRRRRARLSGRPVCGFARAGDRGFGVSLAGCAGAAAEVVRCGVILPSFRDACLCASRSACDRLGVLPVFGPDVCVKVCVVVRFAGRLGGN